MTYKVTAAYVTLKVKNDLGQDVLREFYQGAVLPDECDQEGLDRLVRKGMVAKEGTPEADSLYPGGRPVQFDSAGMAVEPKATTEPAPDGPPAQYAAKPVWVEYAVSKRDDGVSEEQARADAEAQSKADLVAKYGG